MALRPPAASSCDNTHQLLPHLLGLLGKACLPQVSQLVGVLVCQSILNSACMQMYKDMACYKGVNTCGLTDCLQCSHWLHSRFATGGCHWWVAFSSI